MDINNVLNKYNQNHLIKFIDEITPLEKDILINDIKSIDFLKMKKIYDDSYIEEKINMNEISPIEYIDKKTIDKDKYINIGIDNINNYALLTLAGGSGTRLGFNGPKGTYELDINDNKISIFELFTKELNNIKKKYNYYIPWYIMTGEETLIEIKSFFEKNNYFDYPKNKIYFFKQGSLPILDIKGNILLKEKYKILKESDGNGSVFKALNTESLISNMDDNNIKYIQISSIDNILTKVFDPIFLGLMIKDNYDIATKSLYKEDPLSNDYVFCNYHNKPYLLDYNYHNDFIRNNYRDINIAIHIFSINAIKKLSNIELPYHRAYKHYSFYNIKGIKDTNLERNSFKFEHYIFDAFSYFNKLLIYRVDKETEFAPIKNKEGLNSPKTAIELYIKAKKN